MRTVLAVRRSRPRRVMMHQGKKFRLKGCARPFFVFLGFTSFLALVLFYSVTSEARRRCITSPLAKGSMCPDDIHVVKLSTGGPSPYNLPAFSSSHVVDGGILQTVTSDNVPSGKNWTTFPRKINHSIVAPLASPNTTHPEALVSVVQTKSLRPTTPAKHSGPTKVLVVAYFRSGSTYFSEMFNFNPDAFYMFEPLAYFLLPENQSLTLLNGSVRALKDMENNKYIASIIDDILNCRLASLPTWYLKHPFLTKSNRFIRYLNCLQPMRRGVKHSLSFCVKGLIHMCQTSKVRVVKLIRYGISVKGITTLRQTNPGLKIVHLVRDPRGSVLSQFDAAVPETAYMAFKRIVGYCDKIEKDLKAIRSLNNQTDNKILTLNYEDMAENPSATVKNVYSFLGLKVPTLALVGVRKQSSAKHNNEKFGTARENSTLTAYAWKQKIKYDMVKTIDTYCSSWYPLLGYLPINSRKELADPANNHRAPHPTVLT